MPTRVDEQFVGPRNGDAGRWNTSAIWAISCGNRNRGRSDDKGGTMDPAHDVVVGTLRSDIDKI
jgi:hypothetical protein